MRPPSNTIPAPPFPARAEWINVASLRMDKQHGRPVLVEFWDFCRVHSLRTLPRIKRWHAQYEPLGLRVVSAHAAGFPPSAEPAAVRAAVARLGIEHPVLIDQDFALWEEYENPGWPARYLWGPDGMLADYHYGIGGYGETEQEIRRLLGLDAEPAVPEPDEASLLAPSDDRLEPPWSGPYAAGAVWAVLDGTGEVTVNGERRAVDHPGAHPLLEHAGHTRGELHLEVGPGVGCYAVCFEAGR